MKNPFMFFAFLISTGVMADNVQRLEDAKKVFEDTYDVIRDEAERGNDILRSREHEEFRRALSDLDRVLSDLRNDPNVCVGKGTSKKSNNLIGDPSRWAYYRARDTVKEEAETKAITECTQKGFERRTCRTQTSDLTKDEYNEGTTIPGTNIRIPANWTVEAVAVVRCEK